MKIEDKFNILTSDSEDYQPHKFIITNDESEYLDIYIKNINEETILSLELDYEKLVHLSKSLNLFLDLKIITNKE